MGARTWFFLRPRPGKLRSLTQSAVDDFFFRDGRLPADEEGFVRYAEVVVLLEDRRAVVDAGAVYVVYRATGGLSRTGNQFWHQDVANSEGTVEGTAETGDAFGSSLTPRNFGNDTPADLAIGVPFENVGSIADAGAVNVLYGSRALRHLTCAGDQVFTEASAGVPGGAEANDHFGKALY